jgi:hypothetical protein
MHQKILATNDLQKKAGQMIQIYMLCSNHHRIWTIQVTSIDRYWKKAKMQDEKRRGERQLDGIMVYFW